MAKKFPKETGGGWYELSDGSSVQGKEAAEQAESDLSSGGSTNDSGATVDTDEPGRDRVGYGTGLQSLAVDREIEARQDVTKNAGEVVGEDEDDPRRYTNVAGLPKIGEAESGEPIVAGGVLGVTSGIPAGQEGVNDEGINVSSPGPVVLAQHEANRDEWISEDPGDAYDGSPVDRLKRTGSQVPGDDESATSDVDDDN